MTSKAAVKKRRPYRGVSETPYGRYQASIEVAGITYTAGSYRSAKEAAVARDRAALFLTAKARLNFPRASTRLGAASPEALRLSAKAAERDRATSTSKRTSRFIGVCMLKRQTRWMVQVAYQNRSVSVARFDDELTAAEIYDRVALHLWRNGSMSRRPELNFPRRRWAPMSVAQARAASRSEEKRRTTSRFRGVHWREKYQRWVALLQSDGKWTWLGHFRVEEEAAQAYDVAALRRHGKQAFPNFDPETGKELRGNWRLADLEARRNRRS